MSVAIHLVFARVSTTLTPNATPLTVANVPVVKIILMAFRSLGVMAVDECRTGAVSLGPMPVTIRRVIV